MNQGEILSQIAENKIKIDKGIEELKRIRKETDDMVEEDMLRVTEFMRKVSDIK